MVAKEEIKKMNYYKTRYKEDWRKGTQIHDIERSELTIERKR
jgi:hypothetical protein